MRMVIVGAGAVGGYFGGRLAEAGTDVAFVARGKTLEALRTSGLRIESPLGDVHLHDVQAHDDPAALDPADVVILAVKSWQVPKIAPSLAPLLRRGGCVLPLQNGVDAPRHLNDALGRGTALGGLTKIICHLAAPAQICHIGAQPAIDLGELDDTRSERVERLRETLEAAGVVARTPASIQAAMWEKFLFICAVSGLGAVTRMPLGVLRSMPETRDLLERSMAEILAVAQARQIPVRKDAVERSMAFIDRLPEHTTASMQRDLMDGRPSELEAQNGAVSRLGQEAGVPTPVNEFLYHVLLPLERAARAKTS